MPKVLENWDNLDDTTKEELNGMGNYFCKLHLLANFATETDSYLKEFEAIMLSDDYEKQFAFKTKESSPCQLVRLSCKAFHPRGSDECGVASHFNAYLSHYEMKNNLASFVGNRFNILYYNSSIVYFLKDKIKDFLAGWSEPNGLLKSVGELISNPFNLACVWALGIVDKILTAPFWRVIEHPDMSILAINPYLVNLKHELDSLSKNASSVLKGRLIFRDDDSYATINKDEVFDKLFEGTDDEEFEVLTCQALEQIFTAILVILERQAKNQLEGGAYFRPSLEVTESASNVPAHNKISESCFGGLGFLINAKPNAHVETYQAIEMLQRNKTMDWLAEKSEQDRDCLMKKAMSSSEKMKKKYNEKRVSLMNRRREIVNERQREKQEKEVKAALRKAEAYNNLLQKNVMAWITEEQANLGITIIIDKDKLNVIEAQLQFFKHVILSDRKCPYTYFTKSERGKKLTWEQLFEKLIKVIKFTKLPCMIIQNKTDKQLRPVEERNKLLCDQKKKLEDNIFKNRLNREIERRNDLFLDKVIANPDLLL